MIAAIESFKGQAVSVDTEIQPAFLLFFAGRLWIC